MTTATAPTPLGLDCAATRAPRRRFDPLGLVSGLRAYRIYTALDAKSDAQLARMGLDRSSIARAAFDLSD